MGGINSFAICMWRRTKKTKTESVQVDVDTISEDELVALKSSRQEENKMSEYIFYRFRD